jgi:hypothetical protein
MKIPDGVLKTVRGPLLAVAVAGCSSSAPADPPQPQPIAPTPVSEAPSDPVSYDAQAETERLARVDQLLASSEATRDRRIADEDQARETRRQSQAVRGLLGTGVIGIGQMNQQWMNACGRG